MESFAEFFKEGGVFMGVILAVLAVSMAIIVERMILLYRYRVNAGKIWIKVRDLVLSNKIQEAITLCSRSQAPLIRIFSSGLKNANAKERKIQNAVDETMLEVVPELEKRTGHLTILANIATLTGLLGTIFGLRLAFTAVSLADPTQKAGVLATGIAQALNTTAFGLLVAVPVLLCYSFLHSKMNRLIDEIDQFSVKLINLLSERGESHGSKTV